MQDSTINLSVLLRNIFFLVIIIIYASILLVTFSKNNCFIQKIIGHFSNMARSKDSPELLYPLYLGHSWSKLIKRINGFCIYMPALIILWVCKDIREIIERINNFSDIFLVFESITGLIALSVGFVIYLLLVKHINSFDSWLKVPSDEPGLGGEELFKSFMKGV